MNPSLRAPQLLGLLLLATTCLLLPAHAFPPTPHHVIHGTVRDEVGDPLSLSLAQVFLETTNGVTITCSVQPDVLPGENYRLVVPMDSGAAADPYKPIALRATTPFRLKVKIGTTTYLPLEMAGNLANLGKPSASTLLNLTLGVDSDGDGLPDAWEYALIQMLGGGLTLADITPNGDADGDGISNYNEYVAGTYAFDPQDGLRLSLVGGTTAAPLLEFLAIGGRTYSLYASTNLQSWTAVQFRIPANGPGAALMPSYPATGVGLLRVEPALPAGVPTTSYFFKAKVQ